MCQRITCSTCGKPTHAGCGRHIEQLLGDVLPAERCRCREEKPEGAATGKKVSGSLLSRIFGR